jgi:glycosyltransferase involved in cell wall biosynthesis
LADLFNHAQLADAIIRLINDPEAAREMGRLGRQFVREHFSWLKTTSTILADIQRRRDIKS